ncbi:hypothetical protein AX774_g2382 [Zancudomyces culisetae]|uniref:Uncharacterized protein n=1 Tax=Zancudomyces culisetae TaxID=1213189 RepID=A0A1R1PT97_ZANCU|nr:hypothetical protein AX774_g5337 [Zancudomyces culisetae]OMH84112.1 hypothetical protein AX774_g2382 [Zancudomyces culisetae]|eukprot:OMH81210.1 hypothetical protein AX774_g5337 [Zancudomyces culisetae]
MYRLALVTAIPFLTLCKSVLGDCAGKKFIGYLGTNPKNKSVVFLHMEQDGRVVANRWIPMRKADRICKGENCHFYAPFGDQAIIFSKNNYFLVCDNNASRTYKYKHKYDSGCAGKPVTDCKFSSRFIGTFKNEL